MEKASSSDHTEVLVVSSKTELKVSFAGTLLNPQTWNKCCMPAISCTELTIKQDPGLPVQFVLCFLFQPWLLRFPEVSPGQLVLKVSWIGYCHPNGRMPTYFSLYSPTCFPCKCSRKALSPVPSGGQWWEPKIQRTKNSQGRGKKKNKSKPKPLLWIQSCLWGKLRRSKAYSVPFNWFTLRSTAQHHLCEIKRQGFKWKKNIWGESPLKLQIQFKVTCIKQSHQCFRQKSLNESCFLNHHVLGMLRELWVRF